MSSWPVTVRLAIVSVRSCEWLMVWSLRSTTTLLPLGWTDSGTLLTSGSIYDQFAGSSQSSSPASPVQYTERLLVSMASSNRLVLL